MKYNRVIPRDLFAESKLLKCLGQLALLIHDAAPNTNNLTLKHSSPHKGFQIEIDVEEIQGAGGHYCTNLRLFHKTTEIKLVNGFYSKEPYPLQFVTPDHDGDVFNDDGTLSTDFINALQHLTDTGK